MTGLITELMIARYALSSSASGVLPECSYLRRELMKLLKKILIVVSSGFLSNNLTAEVLWDAN